MANRGDKLGMGGHPPNQIFTYLAHPGKTSKSGDTQNGIMGSKDNLHNYFPNRNEHSNFLYVYFMFAYYLLVTPFRLQKVDHGKFELHRWLPQQILSGCAISLSVLRLGTSLRSSLENIRTNDPVSFFLLFCEVSSFIFKMVVFKGFWTKAEAELKLANFLNSYYIVSYNPYKMVSAKSLGLFYGSYATLGFLRFFFGAGQINSWSPDGWYRRAVSEARYTFFLINGTSIDRAPELKDITPVDTFLTIIHCLSVLSRYMVAFYVDLYILIHIWTLWAPTSGFTYSKKREISVLQNRDIDDEDEPPFHIGSESNKRVQLETVIKQFSALKDLSILVEDAVGDAILPFVGEALFFYAVYFDAALLTEDVIKRFVLMFFYASACCIMVFSADIVRKMRWLKSWLCEQGRLQLIEQNQLAMILDDLANNSVGISASGIFTIHYGFIGTFISVLITYFIIRLQSASML